MENVPVNPAEIQTVRTEGYTSTKVLPLLLLLLVPPLGCVYMLWQKKFHAWLPYATGIYAILLFGGTYYFKSTVITRLSILYNNHLPSPFPYDVQTNITMLSFVLFLQLGFAAFLWYQLHFVRTIEKIAVYISGVLFVFDFIVLPVVCWMLVAQPVVASAVQNKKLSEYYPAVTTTTGSKAFTSAKMGFSIIYPETWSIEDNKLEEKPILGAYTFSGREGEVSIWKISSINGLIRSGDTRVCMPQPLLNGGHAVGERYGWQKTQIGQEMLLGCHQATTGAYDNELWTGLDKDLQDGTFLQYTIVINAPTVTNREIVQKVLSSIIYPQNKF